ncbi:MAG TPA: sortase [Actinomycetota bacterium]|jgi:sortase A
MAETAASPEIADAPRHRRRLSGRVLWIAGLACLLAALGIGAYVWWTLWGTGFHTRAAQHDLRPDFERLVATAPASEAPPRVVPVPGDAMAIITIPSIDVDYVVVEGTDTESLKKGPGHYADTAYPWQDHGRVGIAGHRTTYGAPFWSLNELGEGDRIVLATEYGVFRYRVTGSSIIVPSDGSVLAPTRRPTLVLTTCNPRFSAAERLVVFADRID